MPIEYNGVEFSEACPSSPEFSVMPAAESRMNMNGWFDWDDASQQDASKAYLGYVQVKTGFATLPGLDPPDPARAYFHYVNPFPHPDWPNQFYLADGFDKVAGYLPNLPAVGPNGTATFDEANTSIHFRSPRDGYRTLDDSALIDTGAGLNVPREYFLTRNVEIVEQATSKSQTIPANAGLQYIAGGPGNGQNVSASAFMVLHEGDITIKWYPVPVNGYNEAGVLSLIGTTNRTAFPPPQLPIPGQQPPKSLMIAKAPRTLVWGQPAKRMIRMGDTNFAYELTFRLRWYPYGSNAFFWWNPPDGTTGRIVIGADGVPVPQGNLGGPGYYPVQRPDGTKLFPDGFYNTAFLPAGALN